MRSTVLARFLVVAALAASVVPFTARAGRHLQILRITPSGTGVPQGQEIVFQFDRPMVALGNMARTPSEVPITIEPALHCEWRWLDNDELACRLPEEQRFRPATHYTIRVGTALTALDGTHPAAPLTQGFTTLLPGLDWLYFRHWLSPVSPQYLLQFNLPVTKAAVERNVVFARDAGTEATPARASPFNNEREGPLLLPVPGVPGAIMWIANPQPEKPADAGKPAYAARKTWLVAPASPLAPGGDYTLKLMPGLTTPAGNLAGAGGTPENSNGGFVTYGPFRFRGVDCHVDAGGGSLSWRPGEPPSAARCDPDSVQLAFSAPVPLSTLAAAQWTPTPVPASKLAQQWADYPSWLLHGANDAYGEIDGTGYDLPFDFDPMRSYRVEVPAGITDRFGRRLAAPAAVTFLTGHLAPLLRLETTEGILEAGEDTAIPLHFSNLTRLDFDYRTLNAAKLDNPPASAPAPTSVSLLARYGGGAPPDRRLSLPLGVRGMLGGKPGVVAGRLTWAPMPKGWYENGRDIFAEVTPWEVLAKVGHFGTLVWVASLSTGKPVPGVRLRFYRAPKDEPTGVAPASIAGVTDDDGLAILPGTVALGAGWSQRWRQEEKSWYIGAVRGKDMALMPLDWSYRREVGEASGYGFFSRTAPANGHLRAWALTAQGVYLPGATVHYAAFVRGVGITSLTPAPAIPYTLTISDPTGKSVVEKNNVSLSSFGGINGKLYIPKNAATGWYDIVVSWTTDDGKESRRAGRFLVTSFVPASFKVHTLLEGALFAQGDTAKVQAQARLHAGGPYTQAAVKFDLRLEAEPFAPDTPVASGFSFDVNPDDAPDSLTLYQTQDKLDDAGDAKMQFTLPGETPIVYGRLVAQSAVESARGTWVADRASAVWAARDRFVGLRLDDWLLTSGKPFKIHFLVVDASGRPQAGSKVHVVLQRQKINVVHVADGAGNFEPEQKTTWVDEGRCEKTSAAAPGVCKLTPAHAGTYRVVATIADTHGTTQKTTLETWSVGPGEVLWKTGKHVTLVPNKEPYHVGDTARVLVQNPYPGARALVTVERYGILWKKVVTLATATPVLEIPVERSFFPGAYLSVAIFSPRVAKPTVADLGKPTLALGYVALPVEGAGDSLTIAVKPAHTQYKPREDVKVNVTVKDEDGKPAAHTRLVVAVVNEAVLDLLSGDGDYYDPRQVFYAPPEGPDVLDYSLIGQLVTTLKKAALGKGMSPGGGGGKGLAVRSIFKYTAYWKPDLETDARGRARFDFKLPDNLTGWRIIAMALTPGAAMGLGQSTVRVNLPLQLSPALPNVVRAGDRFDAGFSVTNRTTEKHRVTVNIGAQGAGIAAAKSSSTFDLASYAHDIAWLHLAPLTPGIIELLAEARAGKLGDALEKKIPVKAAGVRETAAAYGSLTGPSVGVPVKLPADALPGSGRLEVTLAPTELANLAGAFRHMYEDPLDTWEVRLSRGVMASDYLALRDALPASVRWPDAGGEIADTLDHAADFQAPNGGMAFWIPRNDFVSPYLSVYTALAFDWLDAAGHPPPAGVRSALDGYIKDNILTAPASPTAAAAAPILRAAAMAALAGHASLAPGSVAGMLPKLDELDLFGKALLLEAALETQDAASARRITASILAHAEETSGSLSFQETEADAYVTLLASPLRSNCAVLDALVAVAKARGGEAGTVGDLPTKLLRWIDARRGTDGGWPNSQENVFCTTAAAHYARAYEGTVSDLAATVAAGGKDIGGATFASRRGAPKSLSAAAPATAATVTVARSGEGRLYYGVDFSYTRPAQAVGPADAGFSVRREYRVRRDGDWVRVTPATRLERGDIVRVDLLVDTPAERHYVVLTDSLPGAFEAVNHELATSDANTLEQTPGETTLWFDYGAWPNYSIVTGGFYHRETAFDAVRFYADILPAGRYHLIYAAQVISPGRFLAPPPQVHEIYQPDVFGRGAPGTVTVAPPVATQALEASSP